MSIIVLQIDLWQIYLSFELMLTPYSIICLHLISFSTNDFYIGTYMGSLKIFIKIFFRSICMFGPVAPSPVKVNCRLKCFVTLVTYCCNHVFVHFNLWLNLTHVSVIGPSSFLHRPYKCCFMFINHVLLINIKL
jgi:hypothetical protein